MSKHTPGEWFVDKNQSDFTVSTDLGQEIARCLSADDFPCLEEGTEEHVNDEARANTRLCAGAPKLLEALKQMVADYGDVPDPADSDGQAVISAARAAIAKAEG